MRKMNHGIRRHIMTRQVLKRSAWTRDKVAIAIDVPTTHMMDSMDRHRDGTPHDHDNIVQGTVPDDGHRYIGVWVRSEKISGRPELIDIPLDIKAGGR